MTVGRGRDVRERVMEPLAWAFPSTPVAREVVTRFPERPRAVPPLLFVHGAYTGAWVWDEPVLLACATRGHVAHAVSLRGHGGSGGHAEYRSWTLADYEHDVMQTLVSLPAPPVIVGHGLGAAVAARVLERYPAPGGVLVAPYPARHGGGRVWRALSRHPEDVARALFGGAPPPRQAELFPPDLDPERRAAFAQRFVPAAPRALLGALLPQAARRSRAPVLVVGDADDPFVPAATLDALARHHDAGDPVVTRGLGHLSMLSPRFHEWLDPVLAFAERVGGAGASAGNRAAAAP